MIFSAQMYFHKFPNEQFQNRCAYEEFLLRKNRRLRSKSTKNIFL